MPNYLAKNGKIYYYYRRVPSDVTELTGKRFFRKSLKTEDFERATKLAKDQTVILEEYWKDLHILEREEAENRFKSAQKIAWKLGFFYKPKEELVAAQTLDDLVKRLETVSQHANRKPIAAALLGTVEKPELTLSSAREKYFFFSEDTLLGKNRDQIRIWRNGRNRAVSRFVEVVGDISLSEITRSHVLQFRDFWLEKIKTENLSPNTANKEMGTLSKIYQTVSDRLDLGLKNPFKLIHIADRKQTERTPFSRAELLSFLAEISRSVFREEYKAFVYAMVNTGAAINELSGLVEADIVLEGVPHIKIRTNSVRSLKTAFRPRDIPLVGVSLEAFKTCPQGWPRYQGKSNSLSSYLNRHLREKSLFPSRQHSLYSLRHSFQDRLIEAEVPERIQAELMGHKFFRPKYGKGASLEQKQKWLLAIGL